MKLSGKLLDADNQVDPPRRKQFWLFFAEKSFFLFTYASSNPPPSTGKFIFWKGAEKSVENPAVSGYSKARENAPTPPHPIPAPVGKMKLYAHGGN